MKFDGPDIFPKPIRFRITSRIRRYEKCVLNLPHLLCFIVRRESKKEFIEIGSKCQQKIVDSVTCERTLLAFDGLQSVYNDLRIYVETASSCTNLLKFC